MAPSLSPQVKGEGSYDRDLIPDGMTTTVYMIGFSESIEEMMAFAYRSTNSFKSERLGEEGSNLWSMKPEWSIPDGDDIFALFRPMMMEQRRNQLQVPLNERVEIGGEAIAMHLSEDGCRTFKLFEFPDYPKQMEWRGDGSGKIRRRDGSTSSTPGESLPPPKGNPARWRRPELRVAHVGGDEGSRATGIRAQRR